MKVLPVLVTWVLDDCQTDDKDQQVGAVGIKISENSEEIVLGHIFPLQSGVERYHCVSRIKKSQIISIKPVEVRWDVLSDMERSRSMKAPST